MPLAYFFAFLSLSLFLSIYIKVLPPKFPTSATCTQASYFYPRIAKIMITFLHINHTFWLTKDEKKVTVGL